MLAHTTVLTHHVGGGPASALPQSRVCYGVPLAADRTRPALARPPDPGPPGNCWNSISSMAAVVAAGRPSTNSLLLGRPTSTAASTGIYPAALAIQERGP